MNKFFNKAQFVHGGDVIERHQIVIKMWDNFARLTALLTTVIVWFDNLAVYLDFSVSHHSSAGHE